MSIGPTKKEEKPFNPGIFQKVQYSAKQAITGFFGNPLHYLFYTSLLLLVIGLFLNARLPFLFYVTLFIIGAMRLAEIYAKDPTRFRGLIQSIKENESGKK